MTWRLLLLPLLLAPMSCATTPSVRPDDPLSRLVPSAHSIAPTKPSIPLKTDGTIGTAFDAARVTIEEPSFDEVHSLAWTHNVAAYTAATLNALVPQLDRADTLVRFVVTHDRRDASAGTTMHVSLTTRLSSGQVVHSDVVAGRVQSAEQLGGVLLVAGLVASSATLTSWLFVPGVADQQTWNLRWAGIGLSYALAAAGVAVELFDVTQDEQRWSDVYQKALQAHADDIKRAASTPIQPLAADGPAPPT